MLNSNVKLYKHQERAINKIKEHDGNLILSHGTGSGKTLSAVAAFEKMKADGSATKALVVTPASLRVNFLENGVERFTDSKGAIFGNSQEVAQGIARTADDPDGTADYHVVSYDMFRKDPKKYIESAKADTVIYDELHKIRNDQGATYKTLKDARKYHKNFIGLTGSVMNNTPGDLVPLIDAMTDGKHRLGTKAAFESRFVKEDKKGKHITNDRVVRSLLSPFIDHFETKDLSDQTMPKKVVQEVKVMMSPYQEELYRYTIDKMDPVTALKFRFGASKLQERDINNIFSKLTQARQVSNSIHTVDLQTTVEESAEKTPKVKKLLEDVEEHLSEAPDSQVVVHSNLIRGGVDVIEAGLKKKGIPYVTFIGKGNPGVTEETRQKAVEDFNAGKKKVIVISAAGGEGLDLKNATMFASLDGHFNPEKIHQAEARAVRAGGLAHRDPDKRRVIVKRYVNVVPRSITSAALATKDLLDPVQALKRHMEGAPVFYNPFQREKSTDEWMYDLANRKNALNEEFRQQMQKAASAFITVDDHLHNMEKTAMNDVERESFFDEIEKIAGVTFKDIPYQTQKHVISDSNIMNHYWSTLGDKVEKLSDPSTGLFDSDRDRVEEQKHIDALRKFYREVGKSAPKNAPSSTVTNSKIKTDRDHWKGAITSGVIVSMVGGMFTPPSIRQDIYRAARMAARKVATSPAIQEAAGVAAGSLGPSIIPIPVTVPLSLFLNRNTVHTATPRSQANKMSKLDDDELRSLLRGLSVTKEQVKSTSHFIKGE